MVVNLNGSASLADVPVEGSIEYEIGSALYDRLGGGDTIYGGLDVVLCLTCKEFFFELDLNVDGTIEPLDGDDMPIEHRERFIMPVFDPDGPIFFENSTPVAEQAYILSLRTVFVDAFDRESRFSAEDQGHLRDFHQRYCDLHREVRAAIGVGMVRLGTMGLRTLLDLLCQLAGGSSARAVTDQAFDRFHGLKKLSALLPQDEVALNTINKWGNRAAHDGSAIGLDDLRTGLGIIDRIAGVVWQRIVDPDFERRLIDASPRRKKWARPLVREEKNVIHGVFDKLPTGEGDP